MGMSKRDYIAISAIFAGDLACSANYGEKYRVRGIILSMSDYFAQNNERFDRAAFYVACGLTRNGELVK